MASEVLDWGHHIPKELSHKAHLLLAKGLDLRVFTLNRAQETTGQETRAEYQCTAYYSPNTQGWESIGQTVSFVVSDVIDQAHRDLIESEETPSPDLP